MASNVVEIPREADKLLFAEDLISHFMNKLVYREYPFACINTAPRSERYRRYVHNGFDDSVRSAVDVLYRKLRRKSKRHFLEIAERNAVRSSSFDEYEARLRERYLYDGADAEPFLKYCVMTAAMAKHFLKCDHFDVPDRACDLIVDRFLGKEMAEVSWDLLSRVARRIARDVRESSSSNNSDCSSFSVSQGQNGCACFEGRLEGKSFRVVYRIRNDVIAKHQSKCLGWIFEQEKSLFLLAQAGASKHIPSPSESSSRHSKHPEVQTDDKKLCMGHPDHFDQVAFPKVVDFSIGSDVRDRRHVLEAYNDHGRKILQSQIRCRNVVQPREVSKERPVSGRRQSSTSQLPDASYQNLLKSYNEKSNSENNPFRFADMVSKVKTNNFLLDRFIFGYSDERQNFSSQIGSEEPGRTSQKPDGIGDNMLPFFANDEQNDPPSMSHSHLYAFEPATYNLQDHRLAILRREIHKFFQSNGTSEPGANLSGNSKKGDVKRELPDINYEYLFAVQQLEDQQSYYAGLSAACSETEHRRQRTESDGIVCWTNNIPFEEDVDRYISNVQGPCIQDVSNVPVSDELEASISIEVDDESVANEFVALSPNAKGEY